VLQLVVKMNSGWLFDRLYACLLLVSLPLLPAGGDPQHSALSRSSLQLPPVPYVVDLSTRSPDIFFFENAVENF